MNFVRVCSVGDSQLQTNSALHQDFTFQELPHTTNFPDQNPLIDNPLSQFNMPTPNVNVSFGNKDLSNTNDYTNNYHSQILKNEESYHSKTQRIDLTKPTLNRENEFQSEVHEIDFRVLQPNEKNQESKNDQKPNKYLQLVNILTKKIKKD